MKNKKSSSIIAVIEESLERVKLIEENIRSSKENLYLAEHKLSKKLKLLEKMNIMCNKEKELYTKNDLKRISKNALLVKAEIDLIKKKKEKLNISISEDNERLNDIFNLLTEKGVAVKRNDLLKSLMNEKIRFYEYNYFNREEVLDKYNNIYIIDTNIFIDEPYISPLSSNLSGYGNCLFVQSLKCPLVKTSMSTPEDIFCRKIICSNLVTSGDKYASDTYNL